MPALPPGAVALLRAIADAPEGRMLAAHLPDDEMTRLYLRQLIATPYLRATISIPTQPEGEGERPVFYTERRTDEPLPWPYNKADTRYTRAVRSETYHITDEGRLYLLSQHAHQMDEYQLDGDSRPCPQQPTMDSPAEDTPDRPQKEVAVSKFRAVVADIANIVTIIKALKAFIIWIPFLFFRG